MPGTRAERRLNAWMGREWPGVLAHADQRGRDAFAFEPIASPIWRWPAASWSARRPFRSSEKLRGRWPAVEGAARRAEPGGRRRREEGRKASAEGEGRRAEAAERRRRRYPVPEDALPPLGRVLMTHAGYVVFAAVTGGPVEPAVAARFYPGVAAGPAALIWAARRRPVHAELVGAWPARTTPGPADLPRGWWQPAIEALREGRRGAASLERARATRRSKAP